MDKHTFVACSAVCANVHYLITILVITRDFTQIFVVSAVYNSYL